MPFAARSLSWLAWPWLRSCSASAVVHSVLIVGLAWVTIGGEGAKSPPDELYVRLEQRVPPQKFAVLDVADEVASTVATSGSSGTGPGRGTLGRGAGPLALNLSVALEDLGSGGTGGGASDDRLKPADMRELRSGGDDASFFGIRASGKKFVFIVDMSGSMSEGGRFRRAIAELKQSLRGLVTSQEYFIIFFSNLTVPMPAPDMLAATNDNLLATFRWMKYVEPAGGTFPLVAMQKAHDLKPSAIFLLSDGAFGPEVFNYISSLPTAESIPIHTIALENRDGEPMMRAISKATHGTFRFVR
ncbi:MAG TPA: hypothetical protein VHZ24_09855 [Pirellulales bacterium]|jgi:hypothetical protein|nr:hypothetical protein [Pirellulales bacterium]